MLLQKQKTYNIPMFACAALQEAVTSSKHCNIGLLGQFTHTAMI